MKKNLWLDYWDKKNIWTNSYLWKKNSKIFYKNTTKIFKYNKKMNILDIGCGNGDIAEKISKKVNQVFCVDISKEYVKICKKRFKKNKNIHVKLIKGNYTNLSFLKKKNFSIVLCNSVVQYYNSQKEIIDFIRAFSKPYNGAYTFLNGKKVRIYNAKQKKTKTKFHPFQNGMIFKIEKQKFYVASKQHEIVIEKKNTKNFQSNIKRYLGKKFLNA